MRFSIMFSVLAASAMVSAKMVVKRSAGDVQNAIDSVSNNCDSILSQLDACQADQCATDLANQLASAIGPCASAIKPLQCQAGTDAVAQSGADLTTVSLRNIGRSDTLRSRLFIENREPYPVAQEQMCQLP